MRGHLLQVGTYNISQSTLLTTYIHSYMYVVSYLQVPGWGYINVHTVRLARIRYLRSRI